MPKTPREILKQWFETGDEPTQAQFENLLDSFHHLDDGSLVSQVATTANSITLTLNNGVQVLIPVYALPTNMPVSFITGLADALNNKVDAVVGKGLSTNDFTTTLLNKLNGLNNYTHPETHTISEVQGLEEALNAKVNTADAPYVLIDGYLVLRAGKTDLANWEVNDKFDGWNGNYRVAGKVIALPFDITDDTKVKLALNTEL